MRAFKEYLAEQTNHKLNLTVGELVQIREALQTELGKGYEKNALYQKVDKMLNSKQTAELELNKLTECMFTVAELVQIREALQTELGKGYKKNVLYQKVDVSE